MIFKRLFTPQHSHSDPRVRIQAIENLDPKVASDKSKLHELAFNDADGQVSLAALEKLKSFPLWLKMSQIAANAKVKKHAQEKVFAILTAEHSDLLSPELRRATILEAKEISIVRHVLEQTDMFCDEPEVVSELLARIDDIAFSRQYLIQRASPAVRSFLIAESNDIDALTKLNRHSALDEHKAQIEERIEHLRARQQRPSQLKESLRLNLSKFKALAEQSDYAVIATKSAELRLSIEASIAELGEFEPESALSLEQKYSQISSAVEHTLARLYPNYQAQQDALAQAEHLHQWQLRGAEVIEQATEFMEYRSESVDDEMHSRVERTKRIIADLLQDTVGSEAEPSLTTELQQLDAKLDLLPRYRAAQEQLVRVISTFEQNYQVPQGLADYEAGKAVFDALKRQVNDVIEHVEGGLPKELQSPWLTLQQEWHNALKGGRKQAEDVLRMCQSKLRAAQGLYKDGKFKAVLAIDKKIAQAIAELPPSFLQRIQRQLDTHRALIAELTDWQAYVASPRLPELINEMQSLAAQVPNNIDERRRQIQLLRKNWNSLQGGEPQHTESMQQEFDSAAEQAYAPVKSFQAERDARRANNKAQAESLLLELEQLDLNAEDENAFAKQFNRLNQRWFALGEIGRTEWRELKQRYSTLSKPLKQRVAAVHSANAEQKERLIKRAEALLQDSTNDVVKQVKALQQQWQKVGFAGSKQDQPLWKTFRGVNDQVFAQLKQTKQSLQNAIESAFNEADSKLTVLRDSIEDSALSVSQLNALDTDIDTVLNDFAATTSELDNSVVRRPLQQLRRFSDELKRNIAKHKRAQEQDRFNTAFEQLFDYLQSRVGESAVLDDNAPKLPGVSLRVARQEALSRHIITVRLEIITESPSPKQDSELRSQQQVQLMSDKLSAGELANTWQLFALWLACGPLGKDELPLLQRVKVALNPDVTEDTKRAV